jgi:hypothetical protein
VVGDGAGGGEGYVGAEVVDTAQLGGLDEGVEDRADVGVSPGLRSGITRLGDDA